MSSKKELWMEDVTGICASSCEHLEEELCEFGLKLSDAEEDLIFDVIQAILELKGTGDYKNYN